MSDEKDNGGLTGLPSLIETYGSMVVLMFQERPYFWAIEDKDKNAIFCQFCGKYGDHPSTLDHNPLCVIEGLMKMVHHDSDLKTRILSSRKRPVYHFNIELTVYKGGDPKRKKVHHN